MNSYISKFARIPYLTPPPPNPNIKTTKLQHEGTLKTFFEGVEHSFINDPNEKLQMLKDLDANFQLIWNLQSERLPNGAEPNKKSEILMTFLTYLADISIHLFQLCPLPKFDSLKLDYLIIHCLERRIPFEKSVWTIHHYVNKMDVSAEAMTNTLTKINPPDIIFLCVLCKGIYSKNLLNHTAFLKWSTMNIKPEILIDYYKKDFVKTHSLLYYALSSKDQNGMSNFAEFYNLLKEPLLTNQSHIIQFSILCENQKIFSLHDAKCIYQLISNNNLLLERTRYIHQLLISNRFECECTSYLQYMVPNIILKQFPHYNFEIILNSIRTASFFLHQSQQSLVALNMCKTTLSCFNDPVNISALVAWLIRKLNFKIEISSFTEWIYETIEPFFMKEGEQNIDEKIVFALQSLLYELQFQGVFDYEEFHNYIHHKRYFVTRPNSTQLIISELPIILDDLYSNTKHKNQNRKKLRNIKNARKCFSRILFDFHRFYPDNQITSQIKIIKENILENIEMIKTLPFKIRFITSVWLIIDNNQKKLEDRLNFMTLYKFLKEVNVLCLIPEITRNYDFAPLSAKKFLAAYESHGLINKIETIFSEGFSSTMLINTSQVSDFFISFSHMLSLHAFDLVFSLKTRDELCDYINLLFDDLLAFKNISYHLFYQFFTEFCYSKIIPDSLKRFITIFLSSCYLKRKLFNRNIQKERIDFELNDIDNEGGKPLFNSVFTFASFFIKNLFLSNIIKPCEYILISFEIFKEQKTINDENKIGNDEIFHLLESLFQVLYDVIETEKNHFESNDFLTIEVVKSFNSIISLFDSNADIKKSIESIYHNFLIQLRVLKPPQFCIIPKPVFASVLYTLLPAELFSDDYGSVISFFMKNLNKDNLYFWSNWIRDYSEYRIGFPIVHHEPHPESRKLKYINELVDAFWRAKTSESEFIDDELMNECWWILCKSSSISKSVLQRCINKSYFDFGFLHPALIYADESILECLCDTLKEMNSSLFNNDFILCASSVFIIFVSKFSDNYQYYSLIISIANKLLEWILKLSEADSKMLMTLIDTFNFIICWSFDHSSEDESLDSLQGSSISFKKFGNQGSFQDMLHLKIIPNLKKLPKELKRKIVLNKPRRAFKIIPNPHFSDFANQENESGGQFQISTSFNEGGDSNYHFGFFDDVEQFFWG